MKTHGMWQGLKWLIWLAWSPLASWALASGSLVFLHPAPHLPLAPRGRGCSPRWRGAPWCGWCLRPPPPPPSPFAPVLPFSACKTILSSIYMLQLKGPEFNLIETLDLFQFVEKKSSYWGTPSGKVGASKRLLQTSRHCSGIFGWRRWSIIQCRVFLSNLSLLCSSQLQIICFPSAGNCF